MEIKEFTDVLKRCDYSLPDGWDKLTTMKLKANMLRYIRENAPTYLYGEFTRMLTSLTDAKFKREVKQMYLENSNYNN